MRNTVIESNAATRPDLVRPADRDSIRDAAAALRRGLLVAFPTETVYGLGADARNAKAVAHLFAAKGRPRFNPLIVHVENLEAAERIGVFSDPARTLAGQFWPGPLTLVLPRRANAGIAELVTAGLDTIALRVPSGPIARDLIAAADIPVAAPSANRSGGVSATTAAHAAADLGRDLAMVLDAGPTVHGIESTIVEVAADGTAILLRPGAIRRDAIEAVLAAPLAERSDIAVNAPGQLESHYAPRARLRLDADTPEPGEAFIGFGPPPPGARTDLTLSPTGDLVEAAANLFAMLRRLDEMEIEQAAVMPIPRTGLGEAINDRLARAAAPRDGRQAP